MEKLTVDSVHEKVKKITTKINAIEENLKYQKNQIDTVVTLLRNHLQLSKQCQNVGISSNDPETNKENLQNIANSTEQIPKKLKTSNVSSLCPKHTLERVETSRNVEPIMKPLTRPGSSLGITKVKAEHIARLVHQKFNSLMLKDPDHARYKTIAGFVMGRMDYFADKFEVISLATGTKFLTNKDADVDTSVLWNMHAEVLARRSVIKYLFDQIRLIEKDKEKSIFINRGGRLVLKMGVEFYFYVNELPCGVAREFDGMNCLNKGKDEEAVFSKACCRGLQRKIAGDRVANKLSTCSDKICKWNLLGVQGFYLAGFLRPIYLKSIIVGTSFDKQTLDSALFGRYEKVNLPPPFRVNAPSMCSLEMDLYATPRLTRGTNYSIIWCSGDTKPEIIDNFTGKRNLGGKSNFCSDKIHERYDDLVNDHIFDVDDANDLATKYMSARKRFFEAFIREEEMAGSCCDR